jgi:PAS domain S-box-containing protein
VEDRPMTEKPTYEKLEQRIKELEQECNGFKQYDAVLGESEETYRKMVENISVGILVIQDLKIVFVNTAITRYLGYTKDELVNNPNPFGFICPDDLEMVYNNHMKRLKGEEVQETYPFRVVTKAGDIIWVETTTVRVNWNSKPATLSFFTEITERIEAEERLNEAKDYLENIFENSADTIGIVDQHGNFVKWNKMAAHMYGYDFEEMKGKSYFDLYADKDELARMLARLRKESFIKDYEINMQRKDGSIFPCNISISILKDKSNNNIGSVCVARDLSERKQAEKERLQHGKLQGIFEIAGAVCHEMNQPLMAISGFSELVLMDMSEKDPVRTKMIKIKEQVDRLGTITHKLMGITKYETMDYLTGKIIDIDKAGQKY